VPYQYSTSCHQSCTATHSRSGNYRPHFKFASLELIAQYKTPLDVLASKKVHQCHSNNHSLPHILMLHLRKLPSLGQHSCRTPPGSSMGGACGTRSTIATQTVRRPPCILSPCHQSTAFIFTRYFECYAAARVRIQGQARSDGNHAEHSTNQGQCISLYHFFSRLIIITIHWNSSSSRSKKPSQVARCPSPYLLGQAKCYLLRKFGGTFSRSSYLQPSHLGMLARVAISLLRETLRNPLDPRV
jgi:hypothetical protein